MPCNNDTPFLSPNITFLYSILYETVAQIAGKKGGVVCAAVDTHLYSSNACLFAEDIDLPVGAPREALWGPGINLGPGVAVEASSGLRTLTLLGEDAEKGEILDLSVEVNRQSTVTSDAAADDCFC